MAEIIKLFEGYGLVGLVIGALFGLVVMFIFVNERKDKKNTNFIKTILNDAQTSRDKSEERFIGSTDKLSNAIQDLANQLREK